MVLKIQIHNHGKKMSKIIKLLAVSIITTCLNIPIVAHAASADGSVTCNMVVSTSGAAKGGSYNKTFVVRPGVNFIEDFGSFASFDSFTASLARTGGNYVLSVDYFRDVSAFDSVGFKANLTIPNGGSIANTSGGNEFDTSVGGSRSYLTDYSLSCRRL
jgi:hypothetical protein